ncbi:ABC transporter permease [Streptococcus catagoni]|uniref:ABC transporter permease n=1 Tax=Streptococcus catagoni TaxID=2654874 RepID=UPI00140A3AA2|nr:ABC transporter permease [Streptococcus catagoni]
MTELFNKRRLAFQKLHQKYLPYVFNDHFVLVLLFLLGYVLFQYSSLLKNFPKNHLPIFFLLIVIIALLLNMGTIASYLEKADSHYLLSKEVEVGEHLKKAGQRAFLFWGGLQSLALLVLYPLFLKLGFSFLLFWGVFLLLLFLKWVILKRKVAALFCGDHLNWQEAILLESQRKQKVLGFYSLFTNVKGVSTSFKDRSYLNVVLSLVKKTSSKLWTNLYLRAFLRSSDYLGLFVRLTLLATLALYFVSNSYLALILAATFNYLLLFQLIALYHHFDYHYLSILYPKNSDQKAKNLLAFLRALSLLCLCIELPFSQSLLSALLLFLIMLLINLFYLPYKLKNIID